MNIPEEAIEEAAVEYEMQIFGSREDVSEMTHRAFKADAKRIIEAAAPFIAAQALREAAAEMAAVITAGDIAECAAPVEGERGRASAVSGRDVLLEEPAGWLRERAGRHAYESGEPTSEGLLASGVAVLNHWKVALLEMGRDYPQDSGYKVAVHALLCVESALDGSDDFGIDKAHPDFDRAIRARMDGK